MPKILLIEDEHDAAADIADLLQSRGYQVTPAYTGKQGLKLLRDEKFDLAIIDLLLPDMNGTEVCAMIRHDTRLKTLPIIVSTGVGDDSTQEVSQELGVTAFLSKPYSMESLLEAVKRCLE